jgi:predicted PurR-regulated permease PerM
MSYFDFLKRLLTIFIFLVLLLALWRLQSIVLLGFLAVIVAVGISIPTQFLEKYNIPRPLALLVSILGSGLLGVMLVVWIFPVLVSETAALVARLPSAFRESVAVYETWRLSNEYTREYLPAPEYTRLEDVLGVLGFEGDNLGTLTLDIANSALPLLPGIGSVVFGIAANLAVVVVVSIFFLLDPRSYVRSFLLLVPAFYQSRILEIVEELYRTLRTWILAQAISVTYTMILVWVILGWILGMPNAFPVALVAGATTFIPNIGLFIPLIPIVVFTAADDISKLGIIVIAYILIQFSESNIFTPYVVKTNLQIPAGAMLLFQIMAATLFGAVGLLLAVPLLAIIITLVREIYSYDILGLKTQAMAVEVVLGEKDAGKNMTQIAPPLNQGSSKIVPE